MVETHPGPRATTALDLRGVPCPLNCTHVILALEDMAEGEVLGVILDDGDPVTHVTATMTGEGETILSRTRLDDGNWRVEIRRHV